MFSLKPLPQWLCILLIAPISISGFANKVNSNQHYNAADSILVAQVSDALLAKNSKQQGISYLVSAVPAELTDYLQAKPSSRLYSAAANTTKNQPHILVAANQPHQQQHELEANTATVAALSHNDEDNAEQQLIAQASNNLSASNSGSTLIAAEFDAGFFKNTPFENLDTSKFTHGMPALPGEYSVSLFVNDQWRKEVMARFQYNPDYDGVFLCFDPELIAAIRLEEKTHQNWLKSHDPKAICGPITADLPGLNYQFNPAKLSLHMAMPQALLSQLPDGYVPAELWSNGDSTMFINYSFNSYHRNQDSASWQKDDYLSIDAGVMIHNWALRHTGYYNKAADQAGKYRSNSTYLQTDLPFIRAQMRLGDFYTSDDLMFGSKIRGLEIKSDDRMLPPTWRGFAPEVRGIANSNAKVTVKQNNVVIYETSVPPGAFTISDLQVMGGRDDLVVTITESNGETREFALPYTTQSNLIRPGKWRYGLAVGQAFYDNNRIRRNSLIQGSVQYGLNNALTLRSGVQLYSDFQHVLLGSAFNTFLGQWSTDYGQIRSNLADKTENAHYWKLGYNTRIDSTETDLYATYDHYSSNSIRNLTDFLQRSADNSTVSFFSGQHLKNQMTLTLSQRLPKKLGNIFLSSSLRQYHGVNNKEKNIQLGYSGSYKGMTFGLSASKTTDIYSGKDRNSFTLNLSIPLDTASSYNNLSLYANKDKDQHSTSLSYSGSLKQNYNLSYGLNASQQKGGRNSLGGYATYKGSMGQVNVNYSRDKHAQQAGFGLSGALIAHRYGVLLSERVSDTFAIIRAKGAKGAGIRNSYGMYLNHFGQGVVPHLQPYQINDIGIDPKGTDFSVSLEQTAKQIVPRANTMSLIEFSTQISDPVLINFKTQHDGQIPAGAEITAVDGELLGMVLPGSRALLTNAPKEPKLNISWQQGSGISCAPIVNGGNGKAPTEFKKQDWICHDAH